MNAALTRYALPIFLCLTLGLAPFVPEPHIVGKVRWVAGGGAGMGLLDWFDLLMHGFPFLLLVGIGVYDLVRLVTGRAAPEPDADAE